MFETSYQAIRPTLKTGDVVLMARAGLQTLSMMLATRCHWSHVGVLVVAPEADLVLVWEAGSPANVIDAVTRREGRRIEVAALSQRLALSRGRVAVRRLNRALSDDMTSNLQRFRREVQGAPYGGQTIELLKAGLDGVNASAVDISGPLSADLAAEALRAAGILGNNARAFTPRDFSTAGQLPLLRGYELGEETVLS